MAKANKKHHYIPQCYLKNFSNNQTSIHTYDKVSSKVYSPNVESVCEITDFYRLSKDYIEKNPCDAGKELTIECDFFANYIEPEYSQIINYLIECKDLCLEHKDKFIETSDLTTKHVIAKHIAIQFLRLPDIRTNSTNFFNSFMPQLLRLFQQGMAIETGNPDFLKLEIAANCDPVLEHANSTFMNEELVNHFADALANNYWSFLVSEKGNFYTSDFPIVVKPHVSDVIPINLGLTQYGAEVSFPISKDIVLVIRDKEYFAHYKETDCEFAIIDDKTEKHYNMLRYYYAKRHVYSFNNNFSMIECIKNKNSGQHIFKGIIAK